MVPEHDPHELPTALKGEADSETLAGLVSSSRWMGLFWPVSMVSPGPLPLSRPGRGPGFTVSDRAVSVVAGMAEYED